MGFKTILDSHLINHALSKLTIIPNYPEFGIEIRYLNINHYQFKYQTVLSGRFDKQNEDSQVLDETELFINLNFNHNLTQTDIDNIDVKSPLKHQIQQQEMKDSGWRFDKNNSMTVFF